MHLSADEHRALTLYSLHTLQMIPRTLTKLKMIDWGSISTDIEHIKKIAEAAKTTRCFALAAKDMKCDPQTEMLTALYFIL